MSGAGVCRERELLSRPPLKLMVVTGPGGCLPDETIAGYYEGKAEGS